MRRPDRSKYHAASYWEDVAQRITARDGNATFVAGDDTSFYLRKRALFLDRLLAPATANVHQVLEVGCGPGGNLLWLASRGKSVAGADVSPSMLLHARRSLPVTPLTLIDGRRLPFADRSFESVMTATVLQHNPPAYVRALIAELARVAASEVHLFEDTAWIAIRDRRSHWLRTIGWYVEQMAAAGFEPVLHERLPLAAQEVAAALVRVAVGRGHSEGAHVARKRHRAEAAIGWAAQLVDAVLPAGVGLTRMSFRRRRHVSDLSDASAGRDTEPGTDREVIGSDGVGDRTIDGTQPAVDEHMVRLEDRPVSGPRRATYGPPIAGSDGGQRPGCIEVPGDQGGTPRRREATRQTTQLPRTGEVPMGQVGVDDSQRTARRRGYGDDLRRTSHHVAPGQPEFYGLLVLDSKGGEHGEAPDTAHMRIRSRNAKVVKAGGLERIVLHRCQTEVRCDRTDRVIAVRSPRLLQDDNVGLQRAVGLAEVESSARTVEAAMHVQTRDGNRDSRSQPSPQSSQHRWHPVDDSLTAPLTTTDELVPESITGRNLLGQRRDLLADVRRLVVLSPHLDDAVLSCGGLLARAARTGVTTSVVTVFNGLPDGEPSDAAREFHARCGHSDDAMAHREVEDDSAMERLGTVSRRLGLPEALYRRDVGGRHQYAQGQAIFHSGPDAEPSVVDAVTDRLMSTDVVVAADLLIAPLGVGDHIDHQVVATAVQRLTKPLLWYEDIPYTLYDHCRDWESTLGPSDPAVLVVSPAEWQAKLAAADCYISQRHVLWPDPALRHEVLSSYGKSVGAGELAERYWRRRA